MRLASVLFIGVLLAASLARAETWVHTRDNGGGYPMCFDKDSVSTKADGLTYYAVKMCKDTAPQLYAVDCTKNFKVELLVAHLRRRLDHPVPRDDGGLSPIRHGAGRPTWPATNSAIAKQNGRRKGRRPFEGCVAVLQTALQVHGFRAARVGLHVEGDFLSLR